MPTIEIQDLSVSYPQKKGSEIIAIDRFCLTIPNGSFTVITGPSGSGKTSLLRAIAGLVSLKEGSIYLDGTDLSSIAPNQRNFGYITQEYTLFPTKTIYDNLAFPLKATKTPIDEINRRVWDVAEELDIGMLLSRNPRQLSRGQQQASAIAKAMIKKPSVYLFDEPFSNLDPILRKEYRILLKKLHNRLNTTFVFVTHDIADAMALADILVVMDQGSLVQRGTPDQLFNQPINAFVTEFFHGNRNIS